MSLSKKHYRRELFKSYFSALNGNIVVGGNVIYVGSGKIPESEKNYVSYEISQDNDIGTFDAVIREVYVTVNCVKWQSEAEGEGATLDEMVSQVEQSITQDSFTMQNFNLILLHNQGVTDESTESDDYDILYRTLTFKHIIQEK